MRYKIIEVPYRKYIKTNEYGVSFYSDKIYYKIKVYDKKTKQYLNQEITIN